MDAILKIVFGYILTPYWPINAKIGRVMKNQMQYRSRDQNCSFHKFKMADGRNTESHYWPYLSAILAD